MNLTVNGERRDVGEAGLPLTVAGLLSALAIVEGRVAVEVNERVVKKADHGTHRLADGDRVEIVTFVGGG